MVTVRLNGATAVIGACVCLFCGTASAQDNSMPPTLAETLTWLSEKIPEAGRYSIAWGIVKENISTRFGTSGCVITIVQRDDNFPVIFDGFNEITQRIPLASVDTSKFQINKHDAGNRDDPYFSGPNYTYEITLITEGENVGFIKHTNSKSIETQWSAMHSGAAFAVSDEAIAQRIVNALRYAADVCRATKASKPEPF